jgi:hypothetical protein
MGCPQKPDKSGGDIVPWFRSCVIAEEENRTAVEAAAMIDVRVTECSCS